MHFKICLLIFGLINQPDSVVGRCYWNTKLNVKMNKFINVCVHKCMYLPIYVHTNIIVRIHYKLDVTFLKEKEKRTFQFNHFIPHVVWGVNTENLATLQENQLNHYAKKMLAMNFVNFTTYCMSETRFYVLQNHQYSLLKLFSFSGGRPSFFRSFSCSLFSRSLSASTEFDLVVSK